MDKIDNEINAVADKMTKSHATRAQLKATIIEMGPDKIRKAALTLSEAKQTLLIDILKEMALEKADLEGMDMEKEMLAMLDMPAGDGDTFINTVRMDADAIDEMAEAEAEGKGQDEHRNQGGVAIEGWEGQIIKGGEGSKGGKVVGHTKSGKPIYESGNHGAASRGWSAEDHKDAYLEHTEHGYNHLEARAKHPQFERMRVHGGRAEGTMASGPMRTPEETMALVSQNPNHPENAAVMHHDKMGNHHHEVAEKHYKKYKQLKDKEPMAKASEMDKCNTSEPLMKDGEKAAKVSDAKMKAAEDASNKQPEMAKGDIDMAQAKDKIMDMEQKEHGTKDPKKLVDAEKQEHADKKSKLKPMIARMQEKKMEKGLCVSKLASFMGVPADKISQVWDLMEKAEKMLAEEDQAKASEMNANDVKHIDKPAARQPKAQAKNHTQMADGMVADMASETADEAIAAGEKMVRMAKSADFFYNDSDLEQFIPQKLDLLKANTLGRNAHYEADAELMADFAKAVADAKGEALAKSQYGKGPVKIENINDLIEFGLDEDNLKYEDSIRVVEQSGTFFVKSFDEADLVETLQKGETWAEESLGKSQAGEGSRGGKIIGHTKSGKAIYENSHSASEKHGKVTTANDHEGFDAADHAEASKAHEKAAKEHGEKAKAAWAASKTDKPIAGSAFGGHSQSSNAAQYSEQQERHHERAAAHHKKMADIVASRPANQAATAEKTAIAANNGKPTTERWKNPKASDKYKA